MTDDPEATEVRPRLLMMTPSADMYGSDRALLALVPTLVESFRVVIVSAVEGPMLEAAREVGAEIVVGPDWALRRKFFTPTGLVPALTRVASTLRLLRRIAAHDPFDVVYANTVASAVLPFIRLATRAPVSVHVREVPRTGERLNRLYFGRVAGVAAQVICNSTFTADFVRRVEPRLSDRIRIVHDGVDVPAAVPVRDVPVRDAAVGGPLEIVCVGRIHPQKGQAVMIDALAAATRSGHDWRVHFRGAALPEHRELADALVEQAAAAGVSDRIVWHGYGADTAELYRGMDVAVVPSTWPEGFSMVTAEAQMAGLPVVATGPGGPTDIVDDGVTGRIVAAGDAEALMRAVIELEDAQRRREWGAAGRRRAVERFSAERCAGAVAGALTSLLPV